MGDTMGLQCLKAFEVYQGMKARFARWIAGPDRFEVTRGTYRHCGVSRHDLRKQVRQFRGPNAPSLQQIGQPDGQRLLQRTAFANEP
jgi:hypothetical protein